VLVSLTDKPKNHRFWVTLFYNQAISLVKK